MKVKCDYVCGGDKTVGVACGEKLNKILIKN